MSKHKLGSILACSALLLAVVYGLTHLTTPATHRTAVSAASTVQTPDPYTLWVLTNWERAKAGVPALMLDERLNKSAQEKADEMVRTGRFDHVAPDGKRGIEYIPASDIGCSTISENLAMNDPTPVSGWLTSPPHRRTMLDARYDSIGLGISGPYAVQHFCDLP